ncbi:MAG: ROK family protein [Pseudomonadota bacterium]
MKPEPLRLVPPKHVPPLEPGFRPAVLAHRDFLKRVEQEHSEEQLVIGLERAGGQVSRFTTKLLPPTAENGEANSYFADRLVKFLLWQRGAWKIYVGGPKGLGQQLQRNYRKGGDREFDAHLMGRLVYERPFIVVSCTPSEVPAEKEERQTIGGHVEGCRVGFDLGASDRKVAAVQNGKVVFTEEVPWEPRKQSDPQYHYHQIKNAIEKAASKMPRLDAIGGSTAGIIVDNRPMVASLFRAVPPKKIHLVKGLFRRIGRELGVPIVVLNDGEVTALAGAMSLRAHSILGISMGSSLGTGYVDAQGGLTSWVNELAFAPLDWSPNAPVDEWSRDKGCGMSYLSQQCVFRLAAKVGLEPDSKLSDAGKLLYIQERLEVGHAGAEKIWKSMGICLGYAIAQYAFFYSLRNVLILGRCTSGKGGNLLLAGARAVIEDEFPDLAPTVHFVLPNEKKRRLGQSMAAASLPELERKKG